ncbi:diguanylate cyclase [Desulfovibrio sp. SGI.169]|uniref:diguanylate cyclase n=1 Tax=Desulfovibrio sp. SGI.169 TaxID=3420561 RepID=UPI003D05C18F
MFSIKWSWRTLTVFVVSLIFCGTVICSLVANEQEQEAIKMERISFTQSNKLTNVLTKLLYKTQTISALMIQDNGNIEGFEKIAATLVDDPAILNVLLAPGGVVSAVYPLEGNEAVLGLNFFAEGAGNREAAEARNTGQLVLGGPFPLRQGGEALVGRLPVYVRGQFWGLVSVTLKFPQALDGAGLERLAEQNLAYSLWRISPDSGEKQIIAQSPQGGGSHSRYMETPLNILNAEWFLRISPIRAWYQYPESWLYICLGILCSFLLASLVQHNADLRDIHQQLDSMASHDALTGILNRRGLFKKLETLIGKDGNSFSLYYMDLNKFKMFNDVYGHNTGDHVLRVFVEEVQRRVKMPHIFARIGGDEFVVITQSAVRDNDIAKSFDDIRAALQSRKIVDDDSVRVSFSLGRAVYPRDGETIDALIAHADGGMYTEKRNGSEKTA